MNSSSGQKPKAEKADKRPILTVYEKVFGATFEEWTLETFVAASACLEEIGRNNTDWTKRMELDGLQARAHLVRNLAAYKKVPARQRELH